MNPILVVDDENSSRLFIKNIISKYTEIPVLEARSGEEALTIWKQHTLSGFVIDLSMPVMSGVELIHHIREKVDGKQYPIIVLSSKNPEEYVEALHSAHIVGFFGKLDVMDEAPGQGQERFIQTLKQIFKEAEHD